MSSAVEKSAAPPAQQPQPRARCGRKPGKAQSFLERFIKDLPGDAAKYARAFHAVGITTREDFETYHKMEGMLKKVKGDLVIAGLTPFQVDVVECALEKAFGVEPA